MSQMPMGGGGDILGLAQQYDPTPYLGVLDMLNTNAFTQGFGPGGSNPADWNLGAPPQAGGLADIIFGAPGGSLSGQQSMAQPKQSAPLTNEDLRTLAAMMPKAGQMMPFPGSGGLGRLPPQITMGQLALPQIQNPRTVPTLAQLLGLR